MTRIGPSDDEGLNRQFGLEICDDCGKSFDSGCDDECQCEGCLESHDGDCTCEGCTEIGIARKESEMDAYD